MEDPKSKADENNALKDMPAKDAVALATLALRMREVLILFAPPFPAGSNAAAIVAEADAAGSKLVGIVNNYGAPQAQS